MARLDELNMLGAEELADHIGCRVASINNYVKKGLPYKLIHFDNSSGKKGLMNKHVRMFKVDEAIEWIKENAGYRVVKRIN
jgi:uncharacterized HAD superfamily protein